MPKIFISYRREDSAYATDMIFDRLEKDFEVIYDVDAIPFGVDFVEHFLQAAATAGIKCGATRAPEAVRAIALAARRPVAVRRVALRGR